MTKGIGEGSWDINYHTKETFQFFPRSLIPYKFTVFVYRHAKKNLFMIGSTFKHSGDCFINKEARCFQIKVGAVTKVTENPHKSS